MNPYLLVVLALLSVLIDLSFAPGATLFGARPELALVLVALWAALRPQAEAMVLALAAGIGLGLLGSEPLGASVLALAPIVLLGSLSDGRSTERRFIFSIGLVMLGTLVYALALAGASWLLGEGYPLGPGSLRSFGTVMVLNAALAAVLYLPLARISADPAARNELRRY